MRKIAFFSAAAALALSACASRREPVAPPTPVPTPAPRPAPVPEAPRGPVAGSLEDFRVSVGERVFFGYDRFDLTGEARAILDRQAAWLRRYPSVRVLVAGNCDERGTREYNLALGARRAAAARDYLVSLGVEAGRVETVSYGKERPLDPRANEEAWSVNRNAHTQIVSGAVS
ncbi:MAG: peptidoglycan-associated lipoprotein Pal [Hyphomonadaceae bacterium]|nr:peptidoglycan-associated lipoprotein Pal [Hyphomonadaceae bacterium]